jgi:hypothetical protein
MKSNIVIPVPLAGGIHLKTIIYPHRNYWMPAGVYPVLTRGGGHDNNNFLPIFLSDSVFRNSL